MFLVERHHWADSSGSTMIVVQEEEPAMVLRYSPSGVVQLHVPIILVLERWR